MVESIEKVEFDQHRMNKDSRMIGTFGMEAMGKLVKLNVLVVGMRGLGVETAKNLILAGPKSVTLFDPTLVAIEDLSSNFYFKEQDVGKVSRADASVEQLSELNPQYTATSVISSFSAADVSKYSLVCVTENLTSFENLLEINEAI